MSLSVSRRVLRQGIALACTLTLIVALSGCTNFLRIRGNETSLPSSGTETTAIRTAGFAKTLVASDDKSVQVKFYQVGNGLASLSAFSQNSYFMYDCGVNGKFNYGSLSNGEKTGDVLKDYVDIDIKNNKGTPATGSTNSLDIQILILSHPHSDHYSAFPNIFGVKGTKGRYTPMFVLCGGAEENWESLPIYGLLQKMAASGYTTVTYIDKQPAAANAINYRAAFGDRWQLLVLNGGGTAKDPNSLSIIAMLTDNKNNEVLFTGDSTLTPQKAMFKTLPKSAYSYPIDLLQVSHHGSTGNSNLDLFKNVIRPRSAVISCDQSNADKYNLPKLDVYKYLSTCSSLRNFSDNDGWSETQVYFDKDGKKTIIQPDTKGKSKDIHTTQSSPRFFMIPE